MRRRLGKRGVVFTGRVPAFEHFWAVPEAIRFHNIGPARITRADTRAEPASMK